VRRDARDPDYIIAIMVPPTPIELPSLSIPLMSRTKWRREPWSMTRGGAQGRRLLAGRPADDEISAAAIGRDAHAVAGADEAMRRRPLAVHLDLATRARRLREGAGLEETRRQQPLVDADALSRDVTRGRPMARTIHESAYYGHRRQATAAAAARAHPRIVRARVLADGRQAAAGAK